MPVDIPPTNTEQTSISVADVRELYETPANDAKVEALLARAAIDIDSLVKMIDGVSIDTSGAAGPIINATLAQAVVRILQWEESVGRAADSVSQAGMNLSMRPVSERIEQWEDARDQQLKAWLAGQGIYGFKTPKALIFERTPRIDHWQHRMVPVWFRNQFDT